MIPEPTEDGYEGFDSLVEKTNSWLLNQPPSITVINMQSVMAMLNEGKLRLYRVSQKNKPLNILQQQPQICSDLNKIYTHKTTSVTNITT